MEETAESADERRNGCFVGGYSLYANDHSFTVDNLDQTYLNRGRDVAKVTQPVSDLTALDTYPASAWEMIISYLQGRITFESLQTRFSHAHIAFHVNHWLPVMQSVLYMDTSRPSHECDIIRGLAVEKAEELRNTMIGNDSSKYHDKTGLVRPALHL